MLLGLRSLWEGTPGPPPPPIVTPPTATVPGSIGFPALHGTPRPRKRPILMGPHRPPYWEEEQLARERQEEEEFLILAMIDLD